MSELARLRSDVPADWMSTSEFASFLGVSPQWLLSNTDWIPNMKIGRGYKWNYDSLERVRADREGGHRFPSGVSQRRRTRSY